MLSKPFIVRDPVAKARKKCQRKFLYYFPKGFQDEKFIDWERGYKLEAHIRFQDEFNEPAYKKLLRNKEYERIAAGIVRIESKTNLLFSFEKMALRDAVKTADGARAFAIGLYNYIYGKEILQVRFQNFVTVISALPRKQTRVLTWP